MRAVRRIRLALIWRRSSGCSGRERRSGTAATARTSSTPARWRRTYDPGDVVIDRPPAPLRPGDVITFRHSSSSTDRVTHRITEITTTASSTPRETRTGPQTCGTSRPGDRIEGVVVASLPLFGYVITFPQQPAGAAGADDVAFDCHPAVEPVLLLRPPARQTAAEGQADVPVRRASTLGTRRADPPCVGCALTALTAGSRKTGRALLLRAFVRYKGRARTQTTRRARCPQTRRRHHRCGPEPSAGRPGPRRPAAGDRQGGDAVPAQGGVHPDHGGVAGRRDVHRPRHGPVRRSPAPALGHAVEPGPDRRVPGLAAGLPA